MAYETTHGSVADGDGVPLLLGAIVATVLSATVWLAALSLGWMVWH